MQNHSHLTFPAGGYRNLKTFILGRVIYDITVRFTELFVPQNSRTQDQMVQAARSCVQNIAEGSAASAISKETEIKLTGVARASLVELYLDYEDYLRQHGLSVWKADHPLRIDFIARKISRNKEFHAFVDDSMQAFPQIQKSEIAANGALLLINLVKFMLGKQMNRQSQDFADQGGFRERMTRFRNNNRKE